METKEKKKEVKKETKKENKMTFDDTNIALFLIILANILYVVPLITVPNNFVTITTLLFYILPGLLFLASFLYGISNSEKYILSSLTFAFSMPALIIIPVITNVTISILSVLLLSILYFVVVFAAMSLGNTFITGDEKKKKGK